MKFEVFVYSTIISKQRSVEKSVPLFFWQGNKAQNKTTAVVMCTGFTNYLSILLLSILVSRSSTVFVVERQAVTPVILGKIWKL